MALKYQISNVNVYYKQALGTNIPVSFLKFI
jgi:hypothetical protein